MRSAFLSAIAFFCTITFAQQRDLRFERDAARVALIVGNDHYSKWPLTAAVNDAKTIAAALRTTGFDVDVVTDATRRETERAINRFIGKLSPGDVALFYYAGHGIQLEGENYLIPVDFEAQDEADVKYDAYSASRVMDKLDATGARLKIVILDACRNNPFRITRSTGGGLAQMNAGRGSFIAFATSPGSVAVEDVKANNGLFTKYLVKELQSPGLTLNEVFDRVRIEVNRASSGAQLPWVSSSVIGDFRFRPAVPQPAPVPNVAVAAPANDSNAEVLYWSSVKDSTDPDLFVSYLRRFPTGIYAEIAAKRILASIGASDLSIDAPTPEGVAKAVSRAGVRYRQQREFEKAIAAFNLSIKLKADDAQTYVQRAFVHYEQRAYERAVTDATEAIRIAPDVLAAYQIRGDSYLAQSDASRAVQEYDEVLRRDPANAQAQFKRGRAERALNQPEKALADMDKAIESGGSAPWYVERGAVLLSLQQHTRAVQDFTTALRIKGDDLNAYLYRCRTYREIGQFPLALADCSAAIRINPAEIVPHFDRGYTYLEAGDPSQALVDLNEAIRLNSQLAVVYVARGFAYLLLNRREPALADFNEALRLRPKFGNALYGRSVVRRGSGDAAGANADIAAARESGWTEAQIPAFASPSALGDGRSARAPATHAPPAPATQPTTTGRQPPTLLKKGEQPKR